MSPMMWVPAVNTSWALASSVAKKWRALWAESRAALVSTGAAPFGSR